MAAWCDDTARLVHLSRRRGSDDFDVRALRGRLLADLVVIVQDHAPFALEVTPRSIVLDDEPVFEAENSNAPVGERALERELSWVLHRDGVRALRFERGLDEREAGHLLDALLSAAPASATHEDTVTLLWEAGLEHVSLRTEEQSPVRTNPLHQQQAEIAVPHADDWLLPSDAPSDVRRAWAEMSGTRAAAVADFRGEWTRERQQPFADAIEAFAARMHDTDPRPETAEALAAAAVTWVATSMQRSDWLEAGRAHQMLRRIDPDGQHSTESLTHAFGSVDGAAITERLDEASTTEQARLFAFSVHVGAPALPLLINILGLSGKARVRAGATTALAYAFADDPAPLGRWLADSRWHVVRNVVFVLGQIGGIDVIPHLAVAARHIDARVRRAAIHALGQVPLFQRRAVLLQQLDQSDSRLLAAALTMLAREPDPKVSDAILAHLQAAEFESRPEEQKIALLTAYADVAEERAIPALDEVLNRGGWFARRAPERTAAARALARLGTPVAKLVLEAGLRHRSEAVREACDEALAQWGRA
ncbi:MAG: HEAT repeat domain-containing protein [Candidatus Eisenbacteria bacterium]